MKKVYKIAAVVLICAVTVMGFSDDTHFLKWVFSGGLNWGNMVQNSVVDGVSSATKAGGNANVHVQLFQNFETGLDFTFNQEDINYIGSVTNGKRTFTMLSITLPLMYDFQLIKQTNGDPILILGLGIFCSYFPYQNVTETGNLAGYTMNQFVGGPYLRLSYYPFDLGNSHYLGFYLNVFRSFSHLVIDKFHDYQWDTGIINTGVSYYY